MNTPKAAKAGTKAAVGKTARKTAAKPAAKTAIKAAAQGHDHHGPACDDDCGHDHSHDHGHSHTLPDARGIYLISPSSAVRDPATVELARERLQQQGFKTAIDRTAYAEHQRFAGTDAQRLASLA
uniref:LD-carboxypeptidase n=1 Tax=Achromobacter sp. TaxID=134375 RepID=UPI0028A92C16